MHKKILTVVGIAILFLGTCITPSVAIDNVKKSIIPISSCNTLYVGGSGEGNYSSIQDAIDNASNGDTVFVYDDSSPYYENVVVNKSIALIGEGQTSSVIDGGGNGDVVFISADNVHLDGFIVQHSGTFDYGVKVVAANGAFISKNIVTETYKGISIRNSNNSTIERNTISQNQDGSTFLFSCKNTIVSGNLIQSSGVGIMLMQSTYTNISQNIIEDNVYGIDFSSSNNTTIYQNIIRSNRGIGIQISGANNSVIGNLIESNKLIGIEVTGWTQSMIARNNVIEDNPNGIYCWGVHSNNFIITSNTFSNNLRGVRISYSSPITISRNNFIKNEQDVYFRLKLFEKNLFKENYWDNHHGIGPKVIRGKVLLFSIEFPVLYMILEFRIPWLNFDWHPAKEPYDIGV